RLLHDLAQVGADEEITAETRDLLLHLGAILDFRPARGLEPDLLLDQAVDELALLLGRRVLRLELRRQVGEAGGRGPPPGPRARQHAVAFGAGGLLRGVRSGLAPGTGGGRRDGRAGHQASERDQERRAAGDDLAHGSRAPHAATTRTGMATATPGWSRTWTTC